LGLKEDVYKFKQENGLISYEDMISLVHNALSKSDNTFKKALQKRYKYALIDEFQDTDILQWNIFKNIFLCGTDNRLVIIGDPKQAIYGFRGADVFAYYTAKKEMIGQFNAKYYSLNQNWRSVPSLIKAFNKIFGGDNWFSNTEMNYIDNTAPENKKYTDKIASYLNKPPNLIVVELGECSGTTAKKNMANFIANEGKCHVSSQRG